jgi:hypothetical protein
MYAGHPRRSRQRLAAMAGDAADDRPAISVRRVLSGGRARRCADAHATTNPAAPMSATEIPDPFLSCRAGVGELLAGGVPMAEVERTIDAYPLDRDQKDALWLWAIGRREQPLHVGAYHPIIDRGAAR